MTDGNTFFDQPVKSDIRTYDNIRKIVIGQEDDYTIGCLLHCPICAKNIMVTVLLLQVMGGWEGWGVVHLS